MEEISEEKIESEFKEYVKEFKSILNNDSVTNNVELDAAGSKYIKNWGGIFMVDEPTGYENTNKKKSFIINTDRLSQKGEHWVAIHKSNKNKYYIFDSFGRPSDKLIQSFVYNKKYTDADDDQNQRDEAEDCGQRCLGFLKVIDEYGVAAAMLI